MSTPIPPNQHHSVPSKSAIPMQISHYVMRSRLADKLNESKHAKIAIIAAPAGFGKTTVAADWARHHPDQAIWLSLDENDNDPLRFWVSFTTAIQSKRTLSQSVVIIQSIREGSTESGISLLLSEMLHMEPFTLLIDDYHMVEDEQVHKGLAFIVKHIPVQHRLMIMSRTLPPIPLSRIRAQQELIEVNSDDLRFTFHEIQQLQSLSLRQELTIEELSLLEKKTEGWIAGIILAFLSISNKVDRTAYFHSFSGNHRHIFDYLIDEVLSQQPEDIQSFLMRTSMLHSFCPALAEAILLEPEAANIVVRIEQAQLFLVPLDDTRTWYRYHHLFAEALLTKFHSKEHEQTRMELHRRAAAWYEYHGMIIDAVHHMLQAREYETAALWMAKYFTVIIELGEEAALLRWLESMPMAYRFSHPDLFYFQAGIMATSGQPEQAKQFLLQVEAFMSEAVELPQDQQQVLHMKMELYRASVAFYQGDIDTFVHILDQNLEALERFASIVKVINVNEALLYRGPIGFGGRLKKMAYLSGKVSASPERRAMIHHTLQGHGFIFLADLYYEWNRLEEAEEQVNIALSVGNSSGHLSVWVPGVILKSKIMKALKKEEEAEQLLIHALDDVKLKHAPRWRRLLEAAHIRYRISQGSLLPDDGASWISRSHLSIMDRPHVTREYEQIMLARILLVKGDYAQTIQWISRLLSEARRADRIGSQLELLLLLAQAYWSSELWEQSRDALERALRLAMSEGYTRIFWDEGDSFMHVLQNWVNEHNESCYKAEYIYATSLINPSKPRQEPFINNQAVSDPIESNHLSYSFTNREIELMSYLVAGSSNEHIARQLIISTGTVKRYIHHIYQKLGVKNRVQAVKKIQEEGLI